MSFVDIIVSVFQFIAVVLLIIGFIFEPKVVAFEKRIAEYLSMGMYC